MRLLVGGLLVLLALPALARAQDSVIVIDPDLPPGDSAVVRGGPPPDVVAELLAFYNDSATTRMQGDVSFPAGQRVHRAAGAVPRLAAARRPRAGATSP